MLLDTKLNSLRKLYEFGQSPWYDNIEKRLIEDGNFDKLIADGVRGVTTNPTIFEKAINSSDAYDDAIKNLSRKRMNPEEIFDELTASDVTICCDKLAGIYDASKGADGYVSIEVLPKYAHNQKKTVEYAKSILKKISRPNLMIKIPGTARGFECVRELTALGINVNVTLLFSPRQYLDAALSYMDGLKERLKRDMPVYNVNSVASMFVSRIDTKIDAILGEKLKKREFSSKKDLIKSLIGTVAVSNSKIIYQDFKKLFFSESFNKLKSTGAKMQRPLWASTGTKNPSYSDVKYIEELIGEHTVNTMPHNTLKAFFEHGKVCSSIEINKDAAKESLSVLETLGIELEGILNGLQAEGIEAFQKSFDSLIESIKRKS